MFAASFSLFAGVAFLGWGIGYITSSARRIPDMFA